MFLLDSLLLAPGKAVLAMFEELAKKAQEDFLDDASVKQELQEIYKLLEAGTISEKEFDTREVSLLQRLEQIAMAKLGGTLGTPPMELPPASVNGEIVDVDIVEVTDVPVPQSVQEREFVREVVRAPALGRLEMATVVTPPPVAPLPVLRQVAPESPEAIPEPTAQNSPAPPPSSPGATAPPPPIVPATLTMMQAIDSATRQLSMLKLKLSAITSVARADEGWRVTAELLERKSVPDTSDLLGVYELQLDHTGNLLRYERTHMRRRCDLG
jgi:hypothetical protein